MLSEREAELLARIASRYVWGRNLTPTERAEILRIAQGLGCKDSAARACLAPETIRGHRKRLYKKLNVRCADHVICNLLGISLELMVRMPPNQTANASAAAGALAPPTWTSGNVTG